MPSNEQRRETAKRKLERQLENRAARARKRKQLTIAGSVLGLVVVVGVVAVVFTLTRGGDDANTAAAGSSTSGAASTSAASAAGALPADRLTPLPATVDCSYPSSGTPAAKTANPPRTAGIQTTVKTVSVSMATSQGNLGLTLNNANSPCTVNSFLSLASQKYFDNTPCHRLTTSESLSVLQCGDPSGTGMGGPGYKFANEFPTDQYDPSDPAAQTAVTYPRGTIAMANAGADTNGSQFFLIDKDSQLPPQYTVFGTIDETGLQTLDKISAAGVEGGGADGKPALATTITTVQMDL